MNAEPETRSCLKCGAKYSIDRFVEAEYKCPDCDLDVAHLDRAPNGSIRGVFGWLKQEDDVIQDRYRVKSLLGRGGFAATYLVDDLRLDGKNRALKEVPEMLFDAYETSLLSRLNHASIPDITDQFSINGLTYLVLKFGGNKTLESERKRCGGRIPLNILIPWMRQLCDVLSYLHAQNPPVIHRDLKPSNVLLDDDNRVTLIDFGIAKEAVDGQETRTLARAVSHGFSPPEQIGGTGTDPRSDIYALAATFYLAVTGIAPPAAHERLVGKALLEPAQLSTDFPPALNDAIIRALDLNLNNRQASIQEFSAVFDSADNAAPPSQPTGTVLVSNDQLNRAVTTSGSTPIPSIKLTTQGAGASTNDKFRSRWLWALAALLALGIIVAGGFRYWPQQEPEAERDDQSEPVEKTPAEVKEQSALPIKAGRALTPVDKPAESGSSAMEVLNKGLGREKTKGESSQPKTAKKKTVKKIPKRSSTGQIKAKAKPKEKSTPKKDDSWLNGFKVRH